MNQGNGQTANESSPSPLEGEGQGGGSEPQSRRDLLRLAGAAAVGAAGTMVMRAVPAAAASGGNAVLGTTNDSNLTTNFTATAASAPAPLVQVVGQGVTPPTVASTVSTTAPLTQSIPVIGAIGAGGALPPIGSPPVADYPGFAPIQGVGGKATIATAGGPVAVSEGIDGWGFGATGIGVLGESDTGYGVVGGSSGIDLAAVGSGRLLQLRLPLASLTNAPAGPPNYVPNDFEQVRDGNGAIWVSQPAATGSPAALYWRRLNSVIPITPVRIIDTRIGTGGITGPLLSGQTYTWQVAGGSTGIPAGALAIVANFTAAGFSGQGYFAVFPGGTPFANTSTVNWPAGAAFASAGVANGFTAPLGSGASAGKVSVYVSNNRITAHLVVDVSGYVL